MAVGTLRRVLALLALVLAVASFVGGAPTMLALAIALLAVASLL
jgi:hypothetical protein